MIEIKVLFNGVHHHYWENGIKYIDDITSSVILLKVEKQFILIDSGCPIY